MAFLPPLQHHLTSTSVSAAQRPMELPNTKRATTGQSRVLPSVGAKCRTWQPPPISQLHIHLLHFLLHTTTLVVLVHARNKDEVRNFSVAPTSENSVRVVNSDRVCCFHCSVGRRRGNGIDQQHCKHSRRTRIGEPH